MLQLSMQTFQLDIIVIMSDDCRGLIAAKAAALWLLASFVGGGLEERLEVVGAGVELVVVRLVVGEQGRLRVLLFVREGFGGVALGYFYLRRLLQGEAVPLATRFVA